MNQEDSMATSVGFTKKEPKQNLTVRVDGSIIEAAKKKNINISEVVRYALEQAISGKLASKSRKS